MCPHTNTITGCDINRDINILYILARTEQNCTDNNDVECNDVGNINYKQC